MAGDQTEKVVPPTPPLQIRDRERDASYLRIGFLGEGGFARVYEVKDNRAHRRALKVISKMTVRSKKNKTKLWAEIKLHQMLAHPNIVRFDDCFEDDENVYMVLELCGNGSMMDLLKRRKRYTEPEARYYLVQLIGACGYMHQTNVIHRDLKLGNLFLDEDMNIKVGDFGLAALIENPGDRKKTICGTPNYIAPEVLFDTANGHSFEVDIWSVGVILYTMLVGRPPFQTKDVKAIYKRIKENRYEFPSDRPISASAEELIVAILNPDPGARPDINTILKHRFFLNGPFPQYIPASAHDMIPDFSKIDGAQSRRNFAEACKKAKVGASLPIVVDKPLRTALGPSIVQQERDFQNAVQPGSPISALLQSARQPLVRAPAAIKEPALLRKLSASGAQSTLSPVRKAALRHHENAQAGPSSGKMRMEAVGEEEDEEEEIVEAGQTDGWRTAASTDIASRERKLAAQKARIVSEMAATRSSSGLAARKTVPVLRDGAPTGRPASGREGKPQPSGHTKQSLFETCWNNLDHALQKASTRTGYQSSRTVVNPAAPRIFVNCWLDYSGKYGMGFAMTDGAVCVHFNDSSSVVLSPNTKYFDHIEPSRDGDLVQGRRTNYAMQSHPRELDNKVFIIKHFHSYMMEKLYHVDEDYTFIDDAINHGMVFVTRYLRMKHVILFRLSNDVLQFNFYDHTKLILSEGGMVISVIDRHQKLRTWSLESLLAPMDLDASPRNRKRVEGVIHKLTYARDVLQKTVTHAEKPTNAEPTKQMPTRSTGAVEREAARPIR